MIGNIQGIRLTVTVITGMEAKAAVFQTLSAPRLYYLAIALQPSSTLYAPKYALDGLNSFDLRKNIVHYV